MRKTLIMILAVLLSIPYIYGYFSNNRSCRAFSDQCEEEGDKGPVLGQMIIEGASFFLQSNSDYQLFLNKIELSDIYGSNYIELQDIIDKVIENIELAHLKYFEVWHTSKLLDYDSAVLEKLSKFDYSSYQVKNNLNPSIFKQVTSLLKYGYVREAYEKFYEEIGDILEELKIIKTSIEEKTIPEIAKCWRINQLYLESELFGQYVSEVFFAIEK